MRDHPLTNMNWTNTDQINLFLATKSPNTRRVYLSLWKAWVRFSDEPISYNRAEKFILAERLKPAQPGRSASIAPTQSEKTIRFKVHALYAMHQELVVVGICNENPFTKLRHRLKGSVTEDRRPHELIPADKISALLNAPSPVTNEGVRDRAWLGLLFGQGLRRSEVLSLSLNRTRLEENGRVTILLVRTKNHSTYQIPLNEPLSYRLRQVLIKRRLEGANDSDPLFVTYRQDGSVKGPLCETALYRLYKRYCKEIGLKGTFSPHSARASAITHLLDAGVSHRDVMRFSRHSSVGMVEAYDKRRLEADSRISDQLPYFADCKKLDEAVNQDVEVSSLLIAEGAD